MNGRTSTATRMGFREQLRRLVLAGFSPGEAIEPRLVVLLGATLVVLAASLAVMAINFTPASWLPFVAGNLLAGLTYGAIGALPGYGSTRVLIDGAFSQSFHAGGLRHDS